MIEASLIPKLLSFKTHLETIQVQYQVHESNRKDVVKQDKKSPSI